MTTKKHRHTLTLHLLLDGSYLRDATPDEYESSYEAQGRDGGVGAITADGQTCYVAGYPEPDRTWEIHSPDGEYLEQAYLAHQWISQFDD